MQKVIKYGTALFCFFVMVLVSNRCWSEVDFERLSGSDLEMGIGARAIGMGGAFVSVADDASAIFWNPSGLTSINDNQLFMSMNLPVEFSSVAFIFKPDFEKLKDIGFTLGMGIVNRLDFKGDSGSGTWKGYPSHLLDLAMIDIDDGFSGEIVSRTYDIRVSMAMTPMPLQDLSLGINLAHIS